MRQVCASRLKSSSQILIGIPERDGAPIPDFKGVPRMLGDQKLEEWIEQVVNAHTVPRVPIELNPIPIGKEDNIVMAIHIHDSRRAPHMVTFKGDNRYYRRCGSQTLPAEDHEVRELFFRGLRHTEKIEKFLKQKKYYDPYEADFGLNEVNLRLHNIVIDNTGSRSFVKDFPFFTFVSLPLAMEDSVVDTSDPWLLSWLDPNKRRYEPNKGELLYTGARQPTHDGLIAAQELQDILVGYMIVNRNGCVEYCPERLCTREDQKWYVPLKETRDRFQMFLRFVSDLYRQNFARYEQDLRILANGMRLIDTEAAEMWNEPRVQPFYSKNNLQEIYEVEAFQLDSRIDEFSGQFSTRLFNNYGLQKLR